MNGSPGDFDGARYLLSGLALCAVVGVSALALFHLYRLLFHPSIGRRWLELPVITIVLSALAAFWITGLRQQVLATSAPEGALPVYAIGQESCWEFSYPGGQTSLGVLYLPEGQDVRLVLTSRDGPHVFSVPALDARTNVVPGRWTALHLEPSNAGRYEIRSDHEGGHPIGEVAVLRASEWEAWLGGRAPTREATQPSLAERGRVAAASHGCLQCHSTDGTKLLGPTWRGLWGTWRPMSDGSRVFADGGYITESMEEPNLKIVQGFGPVMPTVKGQLDAGEAEAIVELIKTLSPNGVVQSDPGSLVAPVSSPSKALAVTVR